MQTVEDVDFLGLTFPADFLARYQAGAMIKKSWTVKFADNQVLFFGPGTISVPNVTPAQIEAIRLLVAGVKLAELVPLLGGAALAEIIVYLDRNQLIRPVYQNEFIGTSWEKQVEFFTDFVDDPNAAQIRLMNASVCIIGCGGTGNIITQHLVAAGVQKFTLIDDDLIEQNNFNRQFCFDTSNLGQPKAVALKQYILDRNPQAEVEVFCQRVASAADISQLLASRQPTMVIGCADTPPVAIHTYILEYCLEHGVACTFGGVGIHHGRVGPSFIESDRMAKCLEHKRQQLQIMGELKSAVTGTGIIAGSISYLNTIISSFIAADAIDLLAGIRSPFALNAVWKYTAVDRSMVKEQEY